MTHEQPTPEQSEALANVCKAMAALQDAHYLVNQARQPGAPQELALGRAAHLIDAAWTALDESPTYNGTPA